MIQQNNLVTVLLKEYYHPSIAFWRAIEIKEIKKYFKKNPVVHPILDLGCGEGKVAKHTFVEHGIDFGLEVDLRCIDEAKELNIYNNFLVADAQSSPFKKDSFNTVFSNCVIEHIPDNDKLLDTVSSSLKKDGLFVFTVPSNNFGDYLFFHVVFKALGLKRFAEMYSNKRNAMLCHYHYYKLDEWKKRLKQHNLQYVEHSFYMPPNAVKVWDFMAATIFVLEKIGVWRLFEKIFAASTLLDRLRVKIYSMLLSPICNKESGETGGGLLIVARKA